MYVLAGRTQWPLIKIRLSPGGVGFAGVGRTAVVEVVDVRRETVDVVLVHDQRRAKGKPRPALLDRGDEDADGVFPAEDAAA